MNALARFFRGLAGLTLVIALLAVWRDWVLAYYIAWVPAICWAIGLLLPLLSPDGASGGFVLAWNADGDWGRALFERHPERLVILAALPALLLIIVRPYQVKIWQDEYQPYTGVVVRRGFDMSFFSSHAQDYVVLRTPGGREEKRYAPVWRFIYTTHDSTIELGDSIVKERGFFNLPVVVRPAAGHP